MKIIQARLANIDEIFAIYENARHQMRVTGNANQWINGYPSKEVIIADITAQSLYICVDERRIIACFALINANDPTYQKIYHGSWLNHEVYSVIHRLAVLEYGLGVGAFCLNWCLNQQQNIRVDTHEDNIAMQKSLIKTGFKYCGVIKNRWGDNRLAFQYAVKAA